MIYLDNNATTQMVPEVLEAMMPYLTEAYGNAASVHMFGNKLMTRLDEARTRVARLIGADEKDDLTFTSGGTESNNAIIRSITRVYPDRKHIVSSRIEHSSVTKVLENLEKDGYEITWLPVDRSGKLDIRLLRQSIRSDTALVSLMWANNETGVLFPVEEIAKITREKNILFHCDAVQAVGKIEINLKKTPVDYLSISAHKLHGPKGVGLLYARKGVPFIPTMLGGSQQYGRRAGTENVAGIVGFGIAAELATRFLANLGGMNDERNLCEKLERGLIERIEGLVVAGSASERLPNTSQVVFDRIEGEALLQMLSDQEIYASGGSTCTAGTVQPSHVLMGMGFDEKQAAASVRFSLSRFTTEEEIDRVLDILPKLVRKLRSLSSVN